MTSRERTPLLSLDHGDDARLARKSWSDRLHVVAFGGIGWPWLARSLSGGSRPAKAALLRRLDLPADALPHLGSWKADTGYLHRIVDHIERHRPARVVELGAGASTLITARALQRNGGGQLLSVDQHAGFAASVRHWLAEYMLDAEVRAAPLGKAPAGWPGLWYQLSQLPDTIDLLLIDGPPWTIHPYVRGAAESLFDRIPVGGTIMLDDGARPGERVIAHRWRKHWPGFRFHLARGSTKGTLVGVRVR